MDQTGAIDMSYDLFLFAGEVSGDLHGEKLLTELYAQTPQLKVKGVGGPRMRAVGMECLLTMEDFEVMGFIDILSSLPKLIKQFNFLKRHLLEEKPKGIVCIDYPGFNLRLAQALAKKGSPSKRIHYICPTVWAWGKGRIPKMERSLDHLLTILPFEGELFYKKSLDTRYVGHPLIHRIQEHPYDATWHTHYGLHREEHILSIFPGSRTKELERNFLLQLKVARKLKASQPELQIIVSCTDEKHLPLLKKEGSDFCIVPSNHRYELMRASHLSIATSGTVTLELALHQVPTVVTFAVTPLDVFIAQGLLRIDLPYYALPNIIHQGELFPELFGPNLTEATLEKAASDFLHSEVQRSTCIEKCKRLAHSLGNSNASKEAARIILETVQI